MRVFKIFFAGGSAWIVLYCTGTESAEEVFGGKFEICQSKEEMKDV